MGSDEQEGKSKNKAKFKKKTIFLAEFDKIYKISLKIFSKSNNKTMFLKYRAP